MGDRQAAKSFYNQAIKAVLDKQHQEYQTHAYRLFSSACFADPTWSTGWHQAGANNSDLSNQQRKPILAIAAVACWRRALECEEADPGERAKTLANLGYRLHSMGRYAEAEACCDRAIALDKTLHRPWIGKSLCRGAVGDTEGAYAAARTAFERDPKDADAEMQLMFTCLFSGRYAEGFKHNERRFEWRLHSFQHYPYPKWKGEPGVVFLAADQGMGDTLCFFRFLRLACQRATFVHAAVQPELMRLFTHAFVDVPNLNIIPLGSPFPQADYWTTVVSLPWALQLTDDEVKAAQPLPYPQFKIDERSWKVSDRKYHIGIAWAGSPLNDIDAHRNIPIEHFFELYRVPGIQLYGLQIGERAQDINNSGAQPLIRDLSPFIRDVVDTLAFIDQLDLVITVESALGHICATADKECWIPYSYRGKDWRLGWHGENKLWCPQTRVFLQDESFTWEPVFAQIVDALRKRVT